MYCLHSYIAWHDKAWARFVLGCIGLRFAFHYTHNKDKACAAMPACDCQRKTKAYGGLARDPHPPDAAPHVIYVK